MADKTVAVISDGAWQADTAYSLGDTVSNDSLKIYKCITAGTSASSGGPTGTGTDITDNTAHWAYQETVGAAYTSLNAALSGESTDLDTNTCILTGHCHNFEDNTLVSTGTGYITSSSYYINIESFDSHGGVYGTSAYRVKATKDYGAIVKIQENYTRVIGLQVENTGSKADQSNGISVVGVIGYIKNCIIKHTGTGTADLYCSGITNLESALSTIIGINNIIYGFGTGLFASKYDASNLYFYNNTMDISVRGIELSGYSGTIKLKNNLVQNATINYSITDSTPTTLTNLSEDNTSPNSDLRLKTINFVGAGDYHLASTDTDAIGEATNLYNDSDYPFQDDIDGDDRGGSGASWDIGADEYVSGVIAGTTCWGHSTGVEEDNTKTFTGNGSGTATISGSGDSEVLIIAPGEYWNFNTISTNGAQSNVTITLGKYVSGGNTVTKKYRTGTTQAECEAASFSTYSGPVSSTGFFQARLEG